jgi:hypothetical protein
MWGSAAHHDILRDMTPEPLRADAHRAWHVAEALEQDHWAREVAQRGPLATFEASQALWEHMRALRPDWPSDDERRQDLADHVALKDRAKGERRVVALNTRRWDRLPARGAAAWYAPCR